MCASDRFRDFNKKEEDFGTLREYNDYLEMVEDIIFNLSNNVDVEETNSRIAKYKEKNREQIVKVKTLKRPLDGSIFFFCLIESGHALLLPTSEPPQGEQGGAGA